MLSWHSTYIPSSVKLSLNGQCQTEEVVYEVSISSNQPNYNEKKYFVIVEEYLKGRLYYHNLSFWNKFHQNNMKLWQIKMKNYTRDIAWRIMWQQYLCYLCLNEKLEVALNEGENLTK